MINLNRHFSTQFVDDLDQCFWYLGTILMTFWTDLWAMSTYLLPISTIPNSFKNPQAENTYVAKKIKTHEGISHEKSTASFNTTKNKSSIVK